ncbi:MAG: FG-GAP repeat domain-containing protein [Planctomycetota bacterium]
MLPPADRLFTAPEICCTPPLFLAASLAACLATAADLAAQQTPLPQTPCFGRQQFYAAPVSVYPSLGAQQAVGIGDFDGDGLTDFAGIDDGPDVPHIAFAETNGTFATLPITTIGLDWVGDMQAADFDGDGDLDLAIPSDGYANGSAGELRIFANPGAAAARTAPWPDTTVFALSSANHINDIRVRDMDGDGKLDVVARSRSGTNRIIVSLQGSSLASWSTHVFATTYSSVGPEGVHVEDLNGDDTPEIIGDGWFLHATNTSAPWTDGAANRIDWSTSNRWYQERTKLWADDVNGDGAMDILVVKAENGDGDLSWLECTTDPLASTPADWIEHIIKVDVGQMHHVQTGDLDGDGDCDVLVGSFRTNTGGLRAFYNRGGAVPDWTEDLIAARGCYHGGIVDQDGDGDPDIVAIDGYRKPLRYYENITASGQDNSLQADLRIGASGEEPRPGPFPVCAQAGDTLALAWRGPAGGLAVMYGANVLAPSVASLGCLGLQDISGTFVSAAPLLLDAQGTASSSLVIPAALPPGAIAMQGLVVQPNGSCFARLTAAFDLRW